MADNEDENGLIQISALSNVTVSDPLNPETVIINDPSDERVITDEDAEDILQQAIQDAQEFGEEAVTLSYVTSGEGETDPNNVSQEIVNNVITGEETTLVTSIPVTAGNDGTGYEVAYAVVANNGEIIQADGLALDHVQNINTLMMESDSQNQNGVVTYQEASATDNTVTMQNNDFTNSIQQGALNVTLVPANQGSVAPVGSSANPIRIVQQGNQYTPVQQLTAEQLQQIMHVVQEQQLTKTADSNNGSSILYNPQTNTRIVYRVIYPSELHKSSGSAAQSTTITIGSQTAVDNSQIDNSLVQRRTYKKRNREDEEDKVEVPEMSKEEKEERKKHRPRTRSGRVSKPPKHMVKDYKHIHVLDWDEDYNDDSDGGYSDFKISDEDKSGNKVPVEARETEEGSVGVERVKNYKCDGCDKAYIGPGGLRRHYQLNPTHGVPPDDLEDGEKGGTNSISNDSNNVRTNGSIGSISEDSNTQDSLSSQTTPTSIVNTPATVTTPTPSYSAFKQRRRGRPPFSIEGAPGKRRSKLQELVRQCTDDELMEIVLPRLASVITLWEFLMMKVEKGGKSLPKLEDIFREFETLQKQVSKTCQECLIPVVEDSKDNPESHNPKLQINDSTMAACLGLKIGQYQVKTLPAQEKSFHYKFLTTEPRGIPAKRQKNNRRTIEIVTPDELVQSNSKKPRMTTLLTNLSTAASVSQNASSVLYSSNQTSTTTTSLPSQPTSIATPPKASVSATPMQVVINNHVLSSSGSLNMPTTSHVIETPISANGTSCVQRVILSNASSIGSLNSGTVLSTTNNHTPAAGKMSVLGNRFIVTNNSVMSSSSVSGNTNSVIGNGNVSGNSSSVPGGNCVIFGESPNVNNAVPIVLNNISNAITNTNNILVTASSQSSTINENIGNSNYLVSKPVPISVTMDTPTKIPVQVPPVPNLEEIKTEVTDVKQEVFSDTLEVKPGVLANSNNLSDVNASHSAAITLHETVPNQIQNGVHNGVDGAEATSMQMEVIQPDIIEQGDTFDPNISCINTTEHILSADQVEGEIIMPDQIVTSGSNIYQTEDGILIIQNPDGTTFQLQGAEGIPLETVQALLAMESEGQFVEQEQVQAETQ